MGPSAAPRAHPAPSKHAFGPVHLDVDQAEISKRGVEIASLGSQLEAAGMRIDGMRGELTQGGELLERKREKKKGWKVRT